MALGLANVHIGAWTSPAEASGCTVIVPPEGTLGAVAVRGQSPGIRFAHSLSPAGKLTRLDAVVLAGGSAFGQAAADGVTRWLDEQGRGYPVGEAVVPIVAAAHLLDRSVMMPAERPTAQSGYDAAVAATANDLADGPVGAGAGCTIAKVAGLEHAWRSGQGSAVKQHGDLIVGAVVANNAVGELKADDGTWLARARVGDEAERYPFTDGLGSRSPQGSAHPSVADPDGVGQNTVVGCIVTNARLNKIDAHRVADLAHLGIARAVTPAHTWFDGDALFCLSVGELDSGVDLVAELATQAVAAACRQGPQATAGGHGLPGLAD